MIAAALEIGAAKGGDWGTCHSVQWDAFTATNESNRELTNRLTRQSYPLGIIVNTDGKRFLDEGADFRNYTYAKYGKEILKQPGSVAYQIFDAGLRPMLRSEEYDMPGISVESRRHHRGPGRQNRHRPGSAVQDRRRTSTTRSTAPSRSTPTLRTAGRPPPNRSRATGPPRWKPAPSTPTASPAESRSPSAASSPTPTAASWTQTASTSPACSWQVKCSADYSASTTRRHRTCCRMRLRPAGRASWRRARIHCTSPQKPGLATAGLTRSDARRSDGD